ncbi:hypothetical protein SAMN02745127_01527 [Oceanospirillum multiglobuliferum]|nr:hypothetical protein SAMN02745127_01527 [Oceanospirillum multiglobuliferum]
MTVFCQFFYIVHQAVKLPLPLYFSFASQAEAVQSFVGADVAEYWLYNGHPVAVDLFAVFLFLVSELGIAAAELVLRDIAFYFFAALTLPHPRLVLL